MRKSSFLIASRWAAAVGGFGSSYFYEALPSDRADGAANKATAISTSTVEISRNMVESPKFVVGKVSSNRRTFGVEQPGRFSMVPGAIYGPTCAPYPAVRNLWATRHTPRAHQANGGCPRAARVSRHSPAPGPGSKRKATGYRAREHVAGAGAGHFPFGRLARGRFGFAPLVAAGPASAGSSRSSAGGAAGVTGGDPDTSCLGCRPRGRFSTAPPAPGRRRCIPPPRRRPAPGRFPTPASWCRSRGQRSRPPRPTGRCPPRPGPPAGPGTPRRNRTWFATRVFRRDGPSRAAPQVFCRFLGPFQIYSVEDLALPGERRPNRGPVRHLVHDLVAPRIARFGPPERPAPAGGPRPTGANVKPFRPGARSPGEPAARTVSFASFGPRTRGVRGPFRSPFPGDSACSPCHGAAS
jgi:hypothetical protein